jgi:hypothetical protein
VTLAPHGAALVQRCCTCGRSARRGSSRVPDPLASARAARVRRSLPRRYPGSDRSMLVPNCIFRSNGAAILLSNRSSESW